MLLRFPPTALCGLSLFLLAAIGDSRSINDVRSNSKVHRETVYDPECDMTVPQIINRWGYPVEEVVVGTYDKYLLTMHRIPYGKDGPSDGPRPVIFLQHGLEDSSFSFVANLPEQSAGFLFADWGFDVWMGNMRGNIYSRDHVIYDPKSKEFWNFSFDEMVQYDLDAMINEVLKRTNQTALYYAGHSQGTLTMFSKLSRDPTFHNKYIEGMLDVLAKYLWEEVKFFYWLLGDGEFLPTGRLYDMIAEYVCEETGGSAVDSNQLNSTRNDVYFSHIPAGTSTKNVIHWVQMVRSGILRAYDYGSDNNKYYGKKTPPIYDVSLDRAKISRCTGLRTIGSLTYHHPSLQFTACRLADAKDIEEYLLPTLKKQYVVENVKLEDFNHYDFLIGLKAADQVYRPMYETIMKQENEEKEKAAALRNNVLH
ncbi:AB-hydrolase associated lipase region and Alpha beta hydrolase fold-1 domain containing protein [Aphelenchoides fujianensis]|nr:AB-hydrolase associated lipase region and Alpha beta hydrolase fold-1 domain containing protein [Aphelenchoides fujianensis]